MTMLMFIIDLTILNARAIYNKWQLGGDLSLTRFKQKLCEKSVQPLVCAKACKLVEAVRCSQPNIDEMFGCVNSAHFLINLKPCFTGCLEH